jgi:hypothetical protein
MKIGEWFQNLTRNPGRQFADLNRWMEDHEVDRSAAFAVSDQEAWWLAVHQLINEAEQETIQAARAHTANPNQCIADVGAGEGVALVRQKLLDARELALRDVRTRERIV